MWSNQLKEAGQFVRSLHPAVCLVCFYRRPPSLLSLSDLGGGHIFGVAGSSQQAIGSLLAVHGHLRVLMDVCFPTSIHGPLHGIPPQISPKPRQREVSRKCCHASMVCPMSLLLKNSSIFVRYRCHSFGLAEIRCLGLQQCRRTCRSFSHFDMCTVQTC